MKLNRLALLFLIILLVTGCGGGGGGVFIPQATLVSIAVTPVNPSIPKGTPSSLLPQGRFQGHYHAESDRAGDLDVNGTGRSDDQCIRGRHLRRHRYNDESRRYSGCLSSATTLTVTPAVLASIAVTPANPSIAVGTTQQFTATGTLTDSTTAGPDDVGDLEFIRLRPSPPSVTPGLATPGRPGHDHDQGRVREHFRFDRPDGYRRQPRGQRAPHHRQRLALFSCL